MRRLLRRAIPFRPVIFLHGVLRAVIPEQADMHRPDLHHTAPLRPVSSTKNIKQAGIVGRSGRSLRTYQPPIHHPIRRRVLAVLKALRDCRGDVLRRSTLS